MQVTIDIGPDEVCAITTDLKNRRNLSSTYFLNQLLAKTKKTMEANVEEADVINSILEQTSSEDDSVIL